jgi:hypothetical protein
MNSQEKNDKSFLKARNYRTIREFMQKTQDEVVKGLSDLMPGNESIKQNVSAWENLKGNPGPKFIDPLSSFFGVPGYLLSVESLTKEYLEKNFSRQKHAPMPKSDASDENLNPDAVWSQVEKSEKYTVVPNIILDKYEILSNREIESREITLQEVRAAMKTAINAKDQVISFLQAEIADLRSRLKQIPPTQDAQ